MLKPIKKPLSDNDLVHSQYFLGGHWDGKVGKKEKIAFWMAKDLIGTGWRYKLREFRLIEGKTKWQAVYLYCETQDFLPNVSG